MPGLLTQRDDHVRTRERMASTRQGERPWEGPTQPHPGLDSEEIRVCVLDPWLPQLTEKEGVRPRAFGGHSVQPQGQVKLASSSGPSEPRVFQFSCRCTIHLLR